MLRGKGHVRVTVDLVLMPTKTGTENTSKAQGSSPSATKASPVSQNSALLFVVNEGVQWHKYKLLMPEKRRNEVTGKAQWSGSNVAKMTH